VRTSSSREPNLGKNPTVASLILASLAGGEKHGYALVKDVETFAGVRLPPGTLYEALERLLAAGLIEAVDSDDRRRPYRLTTVGAEALAEHLKTQRQIVRTGLQRLRVGWSLTPMGERA
jgi:DNA-binding PadR family transcriptional regulator